MATSSGFDSFYNPYYSFNSAGGAGWGGMLPNGCVIRCPRPPFPGFPGACPPGCCPCGPSQPWPPQPPVQPPWPPVQPPWPPVQPPWPPVQPPWPPQPPCGGGCCGGGNCCCNPRCPSGCRSCDNASCPSNPWLDASAIFGGMYRSEIQQKTLDAGTTGVSLDMDAPLPLQNVGFNGFNTLAIQCSGTYELTFFANYRFSADSHLTFYIKANGTTLTETVVARDVTAGVQDSFERSVIVNLCPNTNLIAVVDNASAENGGTGGTLTIPGNGVHLEVIRIGSY